MFLHSVQPMIVREGALSDLTGIKHQTAGTVAEIVGLGSSKCCAFQ
jgi:hypothetical protein